MAAIDRAVLDHSQLLLALHVSCEAITVMLLQFAEGQHVTCYRLRRVEGALLCHSEGAILA